MTHGFHGWGALELRKDQKGILVFGFAFIYRRSGVPRQRKAAIRVAHSALGHERGALILHRVST